MIDSSTCASTSRFRFTLLSINFWGNLSTQLNSIQNNRFAVRPQFDVHATSAYPIPRLIDRLKICPFHRKIVRSLRTRHQRISDTGHKKKSNGIKIVHVESYILFQEKFSQEQILPNTKYAWRHAIACHKRTLILLLYTITWPLYYHNTDFTWSILLISNIDNIH